MDDETEEGEKSKPFIEKSHGKVTVADIRHVHKQPDHLYAGAVRIRESLDVRVRLHEWMLAWICRSRDNVSLDTQIFPPPNSGSVDYW